MLLFSVLVSKKQKTQQIISESVIERGRTLSKTVPENCVGSVLKVCLWEQKRDVCVGFVSAASQSCFLFN